MRWLAVAGLHPDEGERLELAERPQDIRWFPTGHFYQFGNRLRLTVPDHGEAGGDRPVHEGLDVGEAADDGFLVELPAAGIGPVTEVIGKKLEVWPADGPDRLVPDQGS